MKTRILSALLALSLTLAACTGSAGPTAPEHPSQESSSSSPYMGSGH